MNSYSRIGWAMVIAFIPAFTCPVAHTEVASAGHAQPERSIQVKVLTGLPGIAPRTDGAILLNHTMLRFQAGEQHADIARRRIISVTSGEERIETGGTAGKVTRMLIPYGGGLVVGAITHKKVSLLTIEYLDISGQYHGAIFLAPADDIANLEQEIFPAYANPPAQATAIPCARGEVQANTVQVDMIGMEETSAFPPEDRALLYENLIKQLQSEKTIAAVYRAGDKGPAAACVEFKVHLQAIAFKKGDQAVRASVGLLGYFIGTTKLTYHLTIAAQSGATVLDRDMKASESSDTDSLNITKVISKAVVKNLKKSRKQV
jgi:hypothetical protein